MKKRIVAFAIAMLMLSSALSASAAVYRASDWFDSIYFSLNPIGNGNIKVTYGVFGTNTMTKIGVNTITVEEEISANRWETATTYGSSYSYNVMDHMDSFTFGGAPGSVYRVVIEAYAKDGSGSETKTYTSEPVACK